MYPGRMTRLSEQVLASATSITPTADLVRLTGTTTIETIVPPLGGQFASVLFLIPTGGNVVTGLTGNIMNAVTMVDEQLCIAVYSALEAKWHMGPIS